MTRHHPATIQGVAVKSQEIRPYISLTFAANDCASRRISLDKMYCRVYHSPGYEEIS